MKNNPKELTENIKKEAKHYYKWKNMIIRYVIIWFLLIVIILQFLLPGWLWNPQKEDTNIYYQNSGEIEISFLQEDKSDFLQDWYSKIYLDYFISKFSENTDYLKFLYKKNITFLDYLDKELQEENIPNEFKYLPILSDSVNPFWDLNIQAINKYWIRIDEYVDERLNFEKSSDVAIEYLQYLYDEFKDRDLVLIAFFVWDDELKSTMMQQDQKEFENLYLPENILNKYYQIMAFSYIMENLSSFIETTNLYPYSQPNFSYENEKEIDDLIKRSQKEWYSYKTIKKLNPRILWNSISKGRREVKVPKQ